MGLVSDLAGSFGAYQGADRMDSAYKRAFNILDQLRGTATEARDEADPFRTYRPEIARYLSDLVMGRADVREDPGYQFAFDEAMRGTRRKLGAMGLGESGNVLAALQERASGIASQQYGSIIQRLQSLAAAMPGNATAGAQLFGNLESQRISGQANTAIGRGVSQAQKKGALWGGLGSLGDAALGAATFGATGGADAGLGSFLGSSAGYGAGGSFDASKAITSAF